MEKEKKARKFKKAARYFDTATIDNTKVFSYTPTLNRFAKRLMHKNLKKWRQKSSEHISAEQTELNTVSKESKFGHRAKSKSKGQPIPVKRRPTSDEFSSLADKSGHEKSEVTRSKRRRKKKRPDVKQAGPNQNRPKQDRPKQEIVVVNLRKNDPFPGEAPVSEEKMKKYERGEKMKFIQAKSKSGRLSLVEREKKTEYAVKQAARSEILLQEDKGFLIAEEGEKPNRISQHDIVNAVDISSAKKFFELKLKEFGPYHMNYTRNGRFLLIGGAKGHVAAMDWMTKKLLCEMNVMETVNDVKWLHQETLFAVAQKQWTYMYDNQGIEIHCLKMLDSVLRMEFLPYHFLLASANSKGFLSYIDVSVGQKVAGIFTKLGRLDVMCQNPSNAIIHLGHVGGTVTLWSPNAHKPLVKMLCHRGAVRSMAVNKDGWYMATSGMDQTVKVWDLRNYKMLQSYKISVGAGQLVFSQQELLAAGIGNTVQVFNNCCRQATISPSISHRLRSPVCGLQFCPYEDVLGVGHGEGFTSLIVPGAGEANFDALEANPYQTKKQRRHAEVKMLLDKIQPEMIHLDTRTVGQVDRKTYEDTLKQKNKLLFMKPQKIEFEPKYKKKGRSKAGKVEQKKKGIQEFVKRDYIRESVKLKQGAAKERQIMEHRKLGKGSVLDRFRKTDD